MRAVRSVSSVISLGEVEAQLPASVISLANLEAPLPTTLPRGPSKPSPLPGCSPMAAPSEAPLEPEQLELDEVLASEAGADLRAFPPEADQAFPPEAPRSPSPACPCPSPARVVRGQTVSEGGGEHHSAASGEMHADTWGEMCAALPRSAALPRRAGSVPDLHGMGLFASLMNVPPLPSEDGGRALGDCALAEHSAPDLYSLELECRRAQEREELPALTRRQFLSG